jgi:hypothetical protein
LRLRANERRERRFWLSNHRGGASAIVPTRKICSVFMSLPSLCQNPPTTVMDTPWIDGSLLPADGTELPVKPNENFGTFPFEQRSDRQNGLSVPIEYVIVVWP